MVLITIDIHPKPTKAVITDHMTKGDKLCAGEKQE